MMSPAIGASSEARHFIMPTGPCQKEMSSEELSTAVDCDLGTDLRGRFRETSQESPARSRLPDHPRSIQSEVVVERRLANSKAYEK